MGSGNLLNLGDLAEPATVLIEKISSAIGVLYEPKRIRKEAAAKADAALIEANNQIFIGELEKRALARFVEEQAREQKCIEDITTKSLPKLDPKSDPAKMDQDWISNFFGKCRNFSDQEMQELWSTILASEANAPGSVSKRTIDFVAAMDKTEAELFANVCNFSDNSWKEILIFDVSKEFLEKYALSWEVLSHLDSIGLINLSNPISSFGRVGLEKVFFIKVQNAILQVEMEDGRGDQVLDAGKVMLTRLGKELRRFVEINPVENYLDLCLEHWLSNGKCKISTPLAEISEAE